MSKKLLIFCYCTLWISYLADSQCISPISTWPNTGGYLKFRALDKAGSYHKGIDVKAPVGTVVYAIRDGIVTLSGEYSGYGSLNPSSKGGAITIKHQSSSGVSFYAHYGHLIREVNVGDKITRGQRIGTIRPFTNAGVSLPHLHFGIYSGSTFPSSGWGYGTDLTNWEDPVPYYDKICKVLSPPTTPTLSYPVANATNISRIPSVNLGWAGSNATEYRIQIVDAKSFTGFDATSGFKSICNTCVNENVKSATTHSFKGAAANTTYYWTVRASGSGGVSKFSAYNKFTTASDPATIPVLASPADNASNISTTTPLQFTWSASNATEYRIQIIDELKYTGFDATNGFANNCATCLKTVHLANQSSYSLSNLEAGKTYYWTVRANGLGGTSKYATVRKFKTAGGAVPAPTIQPISVSICQGAATTLSATGCAGVVTWSDTKTGTSRNISPTATATYTATCTVSGKVSSKSNTSTITVTANPTTPTLTASPTTISNGSASTLKATNCNGTVYWSNGNTGTQIVVKPTTSTNYSAYCKTNGCTSSSATVAVQVVTPATIPALSLPADNASNISTTTPLQFTWSASNATEYRIQIIDELKYTGFDATNGFANNCTTCLTTVHLANQSSYSLSNLEAGKTYYWTVRANGLGGTSKYATVRKFKTAGGAVPAPTIQPISVSICQGAATTLSATGCAGVVTWSDTKTGTSRNMSPTATATYTATCTVGGKVSSKSNTSTITVTANPTTPTLTASPTTISNGGASTLRAANCNGTVYWSNGDTGTQTVVKPTTSTNYSAYCKTNGCTSSSATVAVQVVTPATIPVLALPADNVSNIPTTTPLQFSWSANNATEYRIQIIDALKYTSFDATNGFANNCATCLKNENIGDRKSYSLSNLEAGKTYYWTVRANGPGGTSKYATVRKFTTVVATVNPPTIQPSSVSICQGATTTLSATGCSGTITWNDGKTGPSRSMSLTATATYTATCTVGGKVSSKSNTSTITVNANPTTPTLTASSTTVNLGGSSTLTASNCNGVVYWNNNLGTGTSKVVTPNTNTLYAANCHANNCVGTDGTIQILVKVPAPVISSNVASICGGQAATLTASGCSNGTINWNNSLGSGVNKTAYPTTTTIYNASCTINGVTSSGSNNVQVTVNKSPSAPSLSANPTSITSGNSSILSATNCNGNVSWNNGSTGSSSIVRPTNTTTYTATCTTNGCKSSSGSVTISVSTPTPSTSNPSIGTYTSCSGSGSQSSSCGSFLTGIIRAKVTSINNGYATIIVSKCNGGSFSMAGTAYAKQSNICGSILTSQRYTSGSGDVTLSVPVSVGSTNIYITVNSNTGDKFATSIITINRSNSAARVSAEEQVLSDNSDQEMVVYPNPTAGEFKVKLANHISKDEVVLIHINSLTNTEFHEEKKVSILELENIIFHLPQGLYTVNIKIPTLEKFLSSKIIVTK